MENAADVAYRVITELFGPDSGVPVWAWIAPLVMIFGRLLMPIVVPETAGAKAGGKSKKKSRKSKKK